MLRTLLWREKYEDAMSDEHPHSTFSGVGGWTRKRYFDILRDKLGMEVSPYNQEYS